MAGDIAAIIHLTRVWMAPEGMLGSNNLLTEEQTQRLSAWVDFIAVFLLLSFYYTTDAVQMVQGKYGGKGFKMAFYCVANQFLPP